MADKPKKKTKKTNDGLTAAVKLMTTLTGLIIAVTSLLEVLQNQGG